MPIYRAAALSSANTFTRGSPNTNKGGTWKRAVSSKISGSNPLPEVVTRSIGNLGNGFSASFSASSLTRLTGAALLAGPCRMFLPPLRSGAAHIVQLWPIWIGAGRNDRLPPLRSRRANASNAAKERNHNQAL